MKKYVIIACGGNGTRMNAGINKVLLPLGGKSVIRRSLEAFTGIVDEAILVIRPEDEHVIQSEMMMSEHTFPVRFVYGGSTRQESILNGLKSVSFDPDDIVLVHDAARCMTEPDLIRRVVVSVLEFGSGVPAIPSVSTYKICDHGFVIRTVPRSSLFEIQTPQGFRAQQLVQASLAAFESGQEVTDDASAMELAGIPVRIIPGSSSNFKLTTMEDYMAAERMFDANMFRVGTGFDVHRLVEGRDLILCGEKIPFELGLLGHSDADVAIHALMDAMLGAASLGDIGQHFPDTDSRYSGISSVILLKKTGEILYRSGYHLVNADITIVAQKPKLLPYIPAMRRNIADTLSCDLSGISVKATTTEKLGYEGRMEGISAHAVCLIGHI